MKVKYFKNWGFSQDCYVGEKPDKREEYKFDYMNIITISKEFFYVFANDEGSSYPDGRIDGFYRLLNVNRRDFEKLKEAAFNSDRKTGITLLRKIHEKNPDRNPNSAGMEGDIREMNYKKIFESYVKAKPILE